MKKKIIIISAAAVILIAGIICAVSVIGNLPATGSVSERESAAESLVGSGKTKKAENTYKSILSEDSANKNAALGLAGIYSSKKEYDKAADTLKNAISASKENDMGLYTRLMQIYRESGNAADALAYIENIHDAELRNELLESAYDRRSELNVGAGNTMGNLTSGGAFAFDKDSVYICDASSGNALCKIYGGRKTQLCGGDIQSINISGEYIYFVDKSSGYAIFKIKKDGSGKEKVKNVMATNLIVLGSRAYFMNWNDECRPYSIKLDGSDMKKLSDKSSSILYSYGTSLFISDKNSENEVYEMSLGGGNEKMLTNNPAYFVIGSGDSVFFRDGNEQLNIQRINADGLTDKALNNSRSAYLNSDGGYIYYINIDDGDCIYKVKTDGSENTKITSDGAKSFGIDGEYVYYFSKNDGNKVYKIRKDGSSRELVG